MQIVAFTTLPGGGRPLCHPLADVHCYLAIEMPFLDSLSPLCRLRFTEQGESLLVSGPLDLWVSSIYTGFQPVSTDFDLRVFNLLHQELSDLGASFPFTKRHSPQGFYLCKPN